MQNNSKKFFDRSDAIKLVIAILLGGTIFTFARYAPPSGTPPASLNNRVDSGTSVWPVYVDPTPQGKNAGISVNAFIANGNARFSQDVYLKGNATGDTSITSPIISIGRNPFLTASGYTVDVRTTGSVRANAVVVESAASSLRPLCADSLGNIDSCVLNLPDITLSYVNTFSYPPSEYYFDITWSSTNATSCTSPQLYYMNGQTSGEAYNYYTYSPYSESEISITCTGPDGSTTETFTLIAD